MRQARLTQLSEEIQESLARAEALGETGNVDGSQACVANTERLKVRPRCCQLPGLCWHSHTANSVLGLGMLGHRVWVSLVLKLLPELICSCAAIPAGQGCIHLQLQYTVSGLHSSNLHFSQKPGLREI